MSMPIVLLLALSQLSNGQEFLAKSILCGDAPCPPNTVPAGDAASILYDTMEKGYDTVIESISYVDEALGLDLFEAESDDDDIEMVAHEVLGAMLGSGHGVGQEEVKAISAAVLPLFNVLPKNAAGRLSAPFMRYLVTRYFSEHHAWTIRGFEPYAPKKSETSDAHAAQIVHSKAARGYVEAILKKTLSEGGFTLADVVVAIASIEELILDNHFEGLQKAYLLNKIPLTRKISRQEIVVDILTSYFLIEHLSSNSTDMEQHEFDKTYLPAYYPQWAAMLDYITGVVSDDVFVHRPIANPFKSQSFAFDDVVRFARNLTEEVGPFSNHECHDLKSQLTEKDVYGTGRVKLADFYTPSTNGLQLLESPDYLAQLGALDNSSATLGPQVIISNYITGINNCLTSTQYYDVCCLNECDAIYQHLEARVGSPVGSAAQIRAAIEDGIPLSPILSTSVQTDPRNLTESLRALLEQVSETHKDEIPLHGRLLAQWLHYVFPQECPYPYVSGSVSPFYSPDDVERLKVTDEEIQRQLRSDFARRPPSPDAGLAMWSAEEELLGSHAPPEVNNNPPLGVALNVVLLFLTAITMINMLLRSCCRKSGAYISLESPPVLI